MGVALFPSLEDLVNKLYFENTNKNNELETQGRAAYTKTWIYCLLA